MGSGCFKAGPIMKPVWLIKNNVQKTFATGMYYSRMRYITADTIISWERFYRANFINCLSGF